MGKLWQFSQGHPKPAFSEKVPKGGPREIFQKSPKKTQPSFKRLPKALWRGDQGKFFKWHYPLISMHLKCKDWRRFWRKKGSKSTRMTKLWQFSQGHPKPAFSECKGGTKGNFSKIAQKVGLVSNPHFLKKCKDWGRTKYPNGQVFQKSRIF